MEKYIIQKENIFFLFLCYNLNKVCGMWGKKNEKNCFESITEAL